MSLLRGMKLRQRDFATFDPTDRLAQMLGWWQVERGLVSSGGTFSQLTDLSGNGRHMLPVSGQAVPTIVTSDATLGNKPSIQWTRTGAAQPLTVTGIPLTMPFTIYIAGFMGPDQGVYQYILVGTSGAVGNYPLLWTVSRSPADTLTMHATNEFDTGISIANAPFLLTTVWNVSGGDSGFARNSETYDSHGDLANVGASAILIGTDPSYTYKATMRIAEMFAFAGADTKAQQRDMLGYMQGRYPQSIDFDPPGARYREKFSVQLWASPSAYPVRALSPMLTPTGALRLYTRYTPKSVISGGRDMYQWAQHNAGAGPELHEHSDGTLTVTNNGVSYSTEFGTPEDQAGPDVEYFCAVGGGVAPELAWRCDGPGGAWLHLPLVGGASTPAITASGNIDLGGDAAGNSTVSIFKEAVAFTDIAGPAGYLRKTYPSGVLAIMGGIQGISLECGGWPQLALAQLTKAYPMPRMLGTSGFTSYEQLNTGLAAYTALVVGGSTLNVAFIASGGYGSILSGGDTAAVAYAALQTLCTNLRSGGFNKIIVATVPPANALTDATRLSLNSLITGGIVSGGYADAVCDWAGNATIGATGVQTNATYYQGNQRAWTLAGGRVAAPIAAAALSAVLP